MLKDEKLNIPTTELSPFRSWVPSWLKAVVALTILVPVMIVNGAYSGSNIDISSFLGILSEDINMAYYSTSVGMAIAYIVVPKVRPIATTKTIILAGLLSQVILSFICASTAYAEVIIICSFFIGYFKGFSMIEVIRILMPILSPSGTRNEFYAKFYPITLTCGQVSIVLTAELAYLYKWQHMYFFMILLLLVAMIVVVVCMTYARRLIRVPLKDIDWLSIFLISTCFMCIIFVATYGKTKDWYTSADILITSALIPITGWLFVRRQFPDNDKPPFVDLSVLKNRNSVVVYLMSFVLMFFVSFSILVSSYTVNILKLENTRVNELYLYMIPGFALGGIACYILFKNAVRMAWYIFSGFACFTISIAILYFKVMPNGLYQDLYIPMLLRGVGMTLLFVSFGVYTIQGLSQKQMLYNAFFLIAARSAIAPAVGASILSNWLYRLTQSNAMILSESLTAQDPTTMGLYNNSFQSAMAQGWSWEDAQRIATNSLYSKIQVQALTVSIKEILGWMLIFGIILLIGILLYFFQLKPVRLMKMGADMAASD